MWLAYYGIVLEAFFFLYVADTLNIDKVRLYLNVTFRDLQEVIQVETTKNKNKSLNEFMFAIRCNKRDRNNNAFRIIFIGHDWLASQ